MRDDFETALQKAIRIGLSVAIGGMVHTGALYAMLATSSPAEDVDDDSGPIAIELAPVAVAPPAPKADAPLGPVAQETPPTTPAPPTKTEVAKEEDAPPVPSTPYEPDDPDLRMAKPSPKRNLEETPKDDKTTEAIEQPPAPATVPVLETTAPPPSEAPPSSVAAAPQAGLSETDKRIVARWQRKVVIHLNSFKRYPPEARGRGQQGDVHLTFRIDRSGRILASHVHMSSGSLLLDRAGLDILGRSGNLPAPPPQVAGAEIELRLPIQFRMKD